MTAQDVVVVVQALGTLGWHHDRFLAALLKRVTPAVEQHAQGGDRSSSKRSGGSSSSGDGSGDRKAATLNPKAAEGHAPISSNYRARGRVEGIAALSPEQYAAFMWGCSHVHTNISNTAATAAAATIEKRNRSREVPSNAQDSSPAAAAASSSSSFPYTVSPKGSTSISEGSSSRSATPELSRDALIDTCNALAKQHIQTDGSPSSNEQPNEAGLLQAMSNKALSQLAWACATMSLKLDEGQVHALLEQVKRQAGSMNSQDVSMCMYSIGKIITKYDGAVTFNVTPTAGKRAQMKNERGRQVYEDDRQHSRQNRVPALLDTLHALESRLLSSSHPQQQQQQQQRGSNAYSDGSSDESSEDFRKGNAGSNGTMFRSLSPQSVASIMWSYGTLALRPSAHVLGELLYQSVRLVPVMSIQELCMFVDGMARINVRPKSKMIAAIHLRASEIWTGGASSIKTSAPVGTARAFATSAAAVAADHAFDHTKVLVWACAKLGILPPNAVVSAWTSGLTEVLASHDMHSGGCVSGADGGGGGGGGGTAILDAELQSYIWNSTILDFDLTPTHGCLERHLASNVEHLGDATLARTLWSIAMTESLASDQSRTWDLLSAACTRIEALGGGSGDSGRHKFSMLKSAIHQCFLRCRIGLGSPELADVLQECERRLPGLEYQAGLQFKRAQEADLKSIAANQSDLQRNVETIARSLLPDLQSEVMMGKEGGFYTVDMLSEAAGVAIEVDGPVHYNAAVVLLNDGGGGNGGDGGGESSRARRWRIDNVPSSKTVFKRRAVECGTGMRMVTIPLHEWEAVPLDETLQKEYVQSKVNGF